jgi:cobyrinic acid a,c-diamide synthase
LPCLIAAPCSGSGKTLLSLALAAVARQRGLRLQPFKVGPDYLDPQLLSRVSGLACRNLDPLLCGEDWVERCFHWHGGRADLALVEGVMGLFDGLGSGMAGSSAAVASQLDLPVVLVVEASRQAASVAALVRGFRDHGQTVRPRPVQLAGVVLNRVGSLRHRRLLAEALASIGMPLLGVLPSHPALALPSRHLGLQPAHELEDLAERQAQWASLAEEHLNLERLWPLLQPPRPPADPQNPIQWRLAQESPAEAEPLPLAVASDAAFHFRYPEATEFLEALGIRPLPWSPLADAPLPAHCRGVLLPGGYPELHAGQLAASRTSLRSLRQAALRGQPIVAECGGLLLLGESLDDPEGTPHGMAGLLPFRASRGDLSLGYRKATARADGLLVRRGEILSAHEFHRWQLQPPDRPPNRPLPRESGPTVGGREGLWQVEGWGVASRIEGWTAPNIHASWLHLHWAGCPAIPSRLAAACGRDVPPRMSGASCSPANPVPIPPVSVGV